MKSQPWFAFVALVTSAIASGLVVSLTSTPAAGQTYDVKDAAAGLEALHRGSYDEAIRLLTVAINAGNLPPDDLEFAYLNRGKAFLAKADYADAVADLKRATELKSDDADAKHALERALAGGTQNQNVFEYHNAQYQFALRLPTGWTVHEHADDPSGVRVNFHNQPIEGKGAICNVAAQNMPTSTHLSQSELNAEVSRGDAEVVLRKYGTTANDPTAVLNTGDRVRLGDLMVQKGDMTFQRSGVPFRAWLLMAFVPGRYYIVTCGAPAATFMDVAGDFDTILQSFSVIGG